MKRHLVLEYRIRKLEKAILEDIDSDLDKMSDDILNKMPNDDLDAELDKKAKGIIDKEPGYFYHADEYGDNPKTFSTIDEWLDDKVFETKLNPEFYFDGNVVKRLSGVLKTITRLYDGLDTVQYLKKKIKEISKMNVLVAQQKLANALRKRIKEVERSNNDNKKYEFNTINDWLDSIVFNLDLSNDDVVKVLSDRLKDVSLNLVGGPVWLSSVSRLRKSIKELSNASLPIAQQKLVNALRKRIKDIKNKKQLESLTYEGATKLYEDDSNLEYISDDIERGLRRELGVNSWNISAKPVYNKRYNDNYVEVTIECNSYDIPNECVGIFKVYKRGYGYRIIVDDNKNRHIGSLDSLDEVVSMISDIMTVKGEDFYE